MKTPLARVLIFIITFVLLLVLPWWLTLLVLIGLTIYFPFYIEVLFFGFIFDTLYSSNYTFPYTALTSALVFLMAVSFVKTRIRT